MASQRARPRVFVSVMLSGEGMRVGVVFREEEIEGGRLARKALSMLIVRGICCLVLVTMLLGEMG